MQEDQDQSNKLKRQSKRLSWLLRHGALQEGLSMDQAGWVEQHDLLKHLNLTLADLLLIVQENNKTRFELRASQIRASQGHSLEQSAVTQEGLEASWEEYRSANDSIWHATQRASVASIREQGILRGQRSHVHLAQSKESKVGKRSGAPILIEISLSKLQALGHKVFISPNGVLLTRYVPAECIVNIIETNPRYAGKQAQASKKENQAK